MRDDNQVLAGRVEVGAVGVRALEEQHDGVNRRQRLRVLPQTRLGQRERSDRIDLLGMQREWLATRGQQLERRTDLEQPAEQRRSGQDVLAVVHHEQQLLGRHEAPERHFRRLAVEQDRAQRLDDRRGNIVGPPHGRERNEASSVGEVRLERARDLQREPGLADAARTGEREQPERICAQPLDEHLESTRAADRSVGRHRQPTLAVGAGRHRHGPGAERLGVTQHVFVQLA
ncbi:MAG TPA: hypothetical protein VFG79_24305 [Solirubrobacter sp.]|nr:hypothetical protein [Solirubrobacter sp.]